MPSTYMNLFRACLLLPKAEFGLYDKSPSICASMKPKARSLVLVSVARQERADRGRILIRKSLLPGAGGLTAHIFGAKSDVEGFE